MHNTISSVAYSTSGSVGVGSWKGSGKFAFNLIIIFNAIGTKIIYFLLRLLFVCNHRFKMDQYNFHLKNSDRINKNIFKSFVGWLNRSKMPSSYNLKQLFI